MEWHWVMSVSYTHLDVYKRQVYRCSFEETLFHAFPLACLVVEALQDDRKVLHQEDTAKDGYQQLDVYKRQLPAFGNRIIH